MFSLLQLDDYIYIIAQFDNIGNALIILSAQLSYIALITYGSYQYMKKILLISLLTVMCILGTLLLCACDNSNWLDSAVSVADSYNMVLGYDDTNAILTGYQTVTTTNSTQECITAVKMHLYANSYSQDSSTSVVPTSYISSAYPNGTSYGGITIDSVCVDDVAVAYTIEGDDCSILSIPTDIMLGESATIDISYTITLANIAHRMGYTDSTITLGNFYPIICHLAEDGYDTSPYYNIGDPYVSDIANYTVSITAPSTYTIASSGMLTSASSDGNNTTHHYSVAGVRDFAMVMSEDYQLLSTTSGNTTINYYYYNDSTPQDTLDSILYTYTCLTDNVGIYPYAQYSVAETDMCYGGMEYSCMVMASANTEQYLTAVVHETVHQWFYGIIGNDQINNAWMDEGLTEFVTMLILDQLDYCTLASNIGAMYKAYTTYIDVLSHYFTGLDTSYRALDQYTNDQDYVYTVYVKGSIMFYNIYDTMGSNKFWSALHSYYNSCAGTIATPQQMIDCFSDSFGASMDGLFCAYIQGEDILYSHDSTTTTSATDSYDITIC